MPKPQKDKTLDELDVVEQSPQLSLFEILEPRQNNPYSNTIDLYDALPKYVWEHNREHDDLSKAVITGKVLALDPMSPQPPKLPQRSRPAPATRIHYLL